MSAREEFNKAKEKVAELRKQGQALYELESAAAEEARLAFQKLLVEEKILSQKTWGLDVNSAGTVYLRCDVYSDEWKELSEFAETNYHCRFSLGEDDYIFFDDGEISIHIRDMNQLKLFMEKYGMRVHLSESSKENLRVMKETIAKTEAWMKAFE